MTRRRSSLESVRRAMYFGQRTISDYEAAKRGPEVLAKRLIRRVATREAFSILRRIK